jgi:hypothetical protein
LFPLSLFLLLVTSFNSLFSYFPSFHFICVALSFNFSFLSSFPFPIVPRHKPNDVWPIFITLAPANYVSENYSAHPQLVPRSSKCGSIHPFPIRLHGVVLN